MKKLEFPEGFPARGAAIQVTDPLNTFCLETTVLSRLAWEHGDEMKYSIEIYDGGAKALLPTRLHFIASTNEWIGYVDGGDFSFKVSVLQVG